MDVNMGMRLDWIPINSVDRIKGNVIGNIFGTCTTVICVTFGDILNMCNYVVVC